MGLHCAGDVGVDDTVKGVHQGHPKAKVTRCELHGLLAGLAGWDEDGCIPTHGIVEGVVVLGVLVVLKTLRYGAHVGPHALLVVYLNRHHLCQHRRVVLPKDTPHVVGDKAIQFW